jgi:hypothetical protein
VTQSILDSLPELVGLSAQLVVRELLHLRFEGIDGLNSRHQALDDALVLGPKDLANQSVNQTVKSFKGRELPRRISFSLAYLDARDQRRDGLQHGTKKAVVVRNMAHAKKDGEDGQEAEIRKRRGRSAV